MRLTVLFLFVTMAVLGQEADTLIAPSDPEWSAKNYSQEDKIFNRSVWTFVDNPALAGFDRKLAVAYNFRMRNLAMGVPNKDGNLELAFQKHEAFVDLPFGGPKQNWGMGLYYANEKELQHTYNRVVLAQSIRIQLPKSHNLIIGSFIGVQFSRLENWEDLTFPDMIDPRSGFIYESYEVRPHPNRSIVYANFGLKYYWKRFSFDYGFQNGPSGAFALSGIPTSVVTNRFKAAYLFNIGDGVTVSPEIVGNINTVHWRLNANNSFGFLSAYATITYQDMAFGQLGVVDMNQLSFRAGYQLKDFLVIQASLSSYLDKTMQKIGGIASIDAGIRYQIKAWNR